MLLHEMLPAEGEEAILTHLIKVVESTRAPRQEHDILNVRTTLDFASFVVKRLSLIVPNPNQSRTGGIMAVGRTGDNDFLAIESVGVISDDPNRKATDKILKYTKVILGKIGALLAHPEFLSSAQNASLPPSSQLATAGIVVPGGAMRYGLKRNEILGFSGFATPAEDDCVCLATQVLKGSLSEEEALELARQTGNTIYPQIANYLLGWTDAIPVISRD